MMLDLLLLGLLAVPFAMLFILIGGWINVKITGSNDVAFFKQTFFSLLMGTFFTVSLYAVIMTYGKTIFIIPLLVILYLVWKGRKNEFIFDKKYFLKSKSKLGCNTVCTKDDFDVVGTNACTAQISREGPTIPEPQTVICGGKLRGKCACKDVQLI